MEADAVDKAADVASVPSELGKPTVRDDTEKDAKAEEEAIFKVPALRPRPSQTNGNRPVTEHIGTSEDASRTQGPILEARDVIEAAGGHTSQDGKASMAQPSSRNVEPAVPTPSNPGNGSGKHNSGPSYSEPKWAGPPKMYQFKLETLKGGQIIEQMALTKRSCFKFGRSPGCEVVLEHPSISRLHAVIQFKREDGLPYLYDAGSVHGTSLNKKRIKPKVYAPLSVGDMLKLGQSSRSFIISGPEELMPEEGLSKQQRLQLRAYEAKELRKKREEEVAKAQMAAALNKGISWGIMEEAPDQDAADSETITVDWRAYSQTQTLNERQQKTADRLRRLEGKVQRLSAEADKINAKNTKMEELTPGQAATLARNEQVIEAATDELEELEEQLNNSIAQSLKSKEAPEAAIPSRKRQSRDEEDVSMSNDEDDEFYDRTERVQSKKQRASIEVHDAASLFGKREALLEEQNRVKQALLEEEKSITRQKASASPSKSAEDAASTDAADSIPVHDDVPLDPLDAYMTDMNAAMEQGKVDRLKQEAQQIEAEIKKIEGLLRQADPDGYYKNGTKAAAAAREKGLRLFYKDKEEKAIFEKQKKLAQAKKAAEKAAKELFSPEEEEDKPEAVVNGKIKLSIPTAAVETDEAATSTRNPEIQVAAAKQIPKVAIAGDPAPSGLQPRLNTSNARGLRESKDSTLKAKPPEGLYIGGKGGAEFERRILDTSVEGRLSNLVPPLPQPKPVPKEDGSSMHTPSSILADVDLLRRVMRQEDEDQLVRDQKADEGWVWKRPDGQKGDGLTALNDKLGY